MSGKMKGENKMKRVGIVMARHDNTPKEYAFELPSIYEAEAFEAGTKILVKNCLGLQKMTCMSGGMMISEKDVKKFTGGNELTGKVVGVFLNLDEYRTLRIAADALSDIGKSHRFTGSEEDENIEV